MRNDITRGAHTSTCGPALRETACGAAASKHSLAKKSVGGAVSHSPQTVWSRFTISVSRAGLGVSADSTRPWRHPGAVPPPTPQPRQTTLHTSASPATAARRASSQAVCPPHLEHTLPLRNPSPPTATMANDEYDVSLRHESCVPAQMLTRPHAVPLQGYTS